MKTLKKYLAACLFTLALLTGIVLFLAGNLFVAPRFAFARLEKELQPSINVDTVAVSPAELKKIQNKMAQLRYRLSRLIPGNAFLVINTTENSFRLYKNNQVVREGLCSTGSFIHLEVDSTRHWIFETPKGVLTVKNKLTNPVWRKPDWAFLEEGLPVPPADHPSRYERGVLGDYALNLGDGYLIHGTLYQRLIGMPVTHGCVRLLDGDLEEVYHSLDIGSKVFIY